MNDWISVKERLPEKDGWYFVYAPEYWGNNKIYGLDGLAYSNFVIKWFQDYLKKIEEES